MENFNDFLYTVKYALVTIVGYVGDEKIINVPAEIGKYNVYTIAKNAFVGLDCEEINLPPTLNCIEDGAFVDLLNLKKITMHMMDEISNPFINCRKGFIVRTDSSRLASKLAKNPVSRYGIFNIDCYKDFKMKVVSEEDKTCIITKWKQPSPYINFPDEINGYKVIAIGENRYCGLNLNSNTQFIHLPKYLTRLNYRALFGLKTLKEVQMGDCIKEICDEAFYESNFESIDLHFRNVSYIGPRAFEYAHVSNLIFDDSEVFTEKLTKVFHCCTGKKIKLPFFNTDDIKIDLFSNCYNRTGICYGMSFDTIELDKRQFWIGQDFFRYVKTNNFKGLEQLNIIGKNAFESATLGINELNLSNVKFADDGCFSCLSDEINKVFIPKRLMLSKFMFKRTTLNLVEFEDGYVHNEIPKECFYGTKLNEVNIPDSILKLGAYCLGMTKIKTFDSKNIKEIDEGSFYSCIELNKSVIRDSIEKLSRDCFKECSKLKEVIFEDNCKIESIFGLFGGCKELTKIKLPKYCITLGDNTFYDCYNLREIEGLENIKNVGNFCFTNTRIKKFNLKNMESVGYAAFRECSELEYINLGKISKISSSMLSGCRKLVNFAIPDGITEIGDNAFEYTGIKNIYIPDSVEQVGRYFIYQCDLDNVKIGSKVREIQTNCFSGSKIKNLTLPNGLKYIRSRGIENISNLSKLELPSSLEGIGEYGIRKLDVEEITINGTLREFSLHNFEDCYNLKVVRTNDSGTKQKIKTRKALKFIKVEKL